MVTGAFFMPSHCESSASSAVVFDDALLPIAPIGASRTHSNKGAASTMHMTGRIQGGTTTTLTTKKGESLQKTRLKIIDMGDETGGDLPTYWVDFLGDAALTEAQVQALLHKEVSIDIRRVTASTGKDGKAYTNMTGGAILGDNGLVQVKLGGKTAS